MSFKTTYWLFGILFLLVAVFGLALYLDPLPVDLDAFVFPSAQDKKNPVNRDKVARVVVQQNKPKAEKFTLERHPEQARWVVKKGDATYDAAGNLVEQFADDVIKAQRASKEPLSGPANYGLDEPTAAVTIELTDGRTLLLKVGDSTSGKANAFTYVQSSDRPNILAVKKADLEKVARPDTYFRERDLLAGSAMTVQSVGLSHTAEGAAKEPAVQLVKKADRWAFELPFQGDADNLSTDLKVEAGQPPANMSAILDQITKLRVDYTDEKTNDFVASGVTDWAKYGLNKEGDLLTIDVTRTEQRNPTLPKEEGEGTSAPKTLTSKQGLVVAVGKKVDDKTDKYYARKVGENVVVMVPAGPINALLELLKKPDAARDRHLLTLDSERRVPNAIKLEGGGSDIEFYKRDKLAPWQMYRGAETKPAALDENVVKGVLSLLGQDKMIEGFPPASPTRDADLGLDKPSLVASFWVDGIAEEKKDEKKDDKKDGKEEPKPDPTAKPKLKSPDKPTAKLTFGKVNKDKKTVYVKREIPDEPAAVFEVKQVLFDRLSEGPLAYLDRKLPQFRDGTTEVTAGVTKVQFTHQGKTTEIVRDKDDAPWKVVQPKNLEGRLADPFAVSTLLGNLNRLLATKYLAEKATPVQLTNDYGLNPPANKAEVTLTKDGKPVTYEFLFGKETPDGANVFAKFGGAFGDETVFTIDKSTLNLFDRQLLDPAVFKFDPAKVKEVALRGWSGTAGFPLTLEVARTDDKNWEVKAGPPKADFTLDSAKVNTLLTHLSNLRAERFVAADAAQKIDVKLGGLSIKLTLDGEEKPLTLTLGEADGQGLFAAASTLPGDTVVVSKFLFDGPKGSMAYFKK